jgi:hypothetical protein
VVVSSLSKAGKKDRFMTVPNEEPLDKLMPLDIGEPTSYHGILNTDQNIYTKDDQALPFMTADGAARR